MYTKQETKKSESEYLIDFSLPKAHSWKVLQTIFSPTYSDLTPISRIFEQIEIQLLDPAR